MEEFHGPITEVINQGLTGTLPYNPNYHFVNGRAYPPPHIDDWDGVMYKEADLTDIRQQVQYLVDTPIRDPRKNPKLETLRKYAP